MLNTKIDGIVTNMTSFGVLIDFIYKDINYKGCLSNSYIKSLYSINQLVHLEILCVDPRNELIYLGEI